MNLEDEQRSTYLDDRASPTSNRALPIIQPPVIRTSAPSPGDPMDVISPGAQTMGPPSRSSPEGDSNGAQHNGLAGEQHQHSSASGPNAAAAAQAGSQAPKVVQTAFIHKLYSMLEDPSIQHLISWSNSAESFVMSPSNDFSKVLSQYFKHTNISSFVRQLNMYGFHKVSDVFHTGSPESPLWEFKHGNGNFKRGDLAGLRDIKRRASRHTLIHRDSYSSIKPPVYTQPGTPAEHIPPPQPVQESTESRLTGLEHTLYDMHARLARSEDTTQFLHVRHQVVMDALSRSLQLNYEMSRAVLGVLPNADAPIHRSIIGMQSETQRQMDILRSLEDPQEAPFSGSRPYFSNLSLDGAPVSPRHLAQDDARRGSLSGQGARPPAPFRSTVPAHLSISPRRYGSIGGGSNSASSPGSMRYAAPTPPPPPPPAPAPAPTAQHPLASVQSPPTNLSRRHTSADIRAHGWQPTPSPFSLGHSSSQWPSSPKRQASVINEDQRIRDSFSSYSLQAASQDRPNGSRPATPPFGNGHVAQNDGAPQWSWGSGRGEKFGGGGFGPSGLLKDSSGPPTRRGSMAHILNPAETAERDEEHEEDLRDEDRKRKRIQ